MGLTLLTPPTGGPVSLAEAKSHLRVDSADDDALIERLIASATGSLDGELGLLGRALLTQTWRLDLDTFPGIRPIELPLPPCQSVGSVSYLDRDGASVTLAPSAYRVSGLGSSSFGRISPAPGTRWPETWATPDAISIEFTAGYGAAGDVPEPIRSAILGAVASLYAQRETIVMSTFTPTEFGPLADVIEQYRVSWW